MRRTKLNKLIFLLLAGAISVPVSAGTRDDINALQIGQQEVEQRLARLDSLLQNQGLMEMLQLVEQLRAELQSLRGDVEKQSNELQSLRKRQRELYLDIDRRLSEMQLHSENAATVAASAAAPSTSSESAPTAPSASAAASGGAVNMPISGAGGGSDDQQRQEYKEAFEILREGRYPEAIEVFSTFLQKHPNGKYADNAQYWLGEANYASRNFEIALAEFSKVLERYPRSPKVADAKLKIGYTHYELQQWDKAREVLNGVLAAHPNTSVALSAEKRILSMAEEGR